MNLNTKLSVIIPAFNEEKIIDQCLKSVFKIKVSKLDVIVVDDCSLDKTLSIIKNYPCTLLKNKKNMGAALSKNKALKKTKFENILILDANSIILNGSIEKMLKILLKNKELSGINGMWDFNTQSISFYSKIQALDTHYQMLLMKKEKYSFYWGNGSIIRKTILLKTKGFSSYYKKAGCEDYEIIFRMNNKKKFFIPGIISIHHHFPSFFFNGIKKFIFRTALFIQTYLFYKRKNAGDNWHTTDKNLYSLILANLIFFSIIGGIFLVNLMYFATILFFSSYILINIKKIFFFRRKTSFLFVLLYLPVSIITYLLISLGIFLGILKFLISKNEFKKYN